jgi:hypothetical protein
VTVPPRAGGCRVRGSRTVVAERTRLAGRTPVASFARYADAERTLALLAGTRFPVDRLTLVGGDLKLVDEDTGRATRRAVAVGAGGGAWLGALMAVFTIVLDRPALDTLAVRVSWGVLLGCLFGATMAVAACTMFGRARDVAARRLVAARYELYADGDVAASAWRLLLAMHPTGLTLVDRVPVHVVAVPADLSVAEPAGPVTQPAGPVAEPAGPVAEPARQQPSPVPAHAEAA